MRFLALLLASACAMAQVSFDVGPRELALNEALSFSIVVEEADRGRNPTFPDGMDSGDFELVSRTPSVSSQTSIINGVVSSKRTYTYRLRPTRQGALRFPAQTVVYGGKRFSSQPIDVEVVEARRDIPSRDRFTDPFDRFLNNRREPAEIFAAMETPKTEYYIGEEIPLTTYLYYTPGVVIYQNSSMDLPDFRDFWVEENKEQSVERSVIRDGKRMVQFPVDRRRLYANKTGELEIPSATFQLAVKARSSFSLRPQMIERVTEPLTLSIKPLPSAGRPADFDGLVGRFRTSGELEAEGPVKTGDSVSLKVTVSGRGNFAALQKLALADLGPAFEVFDAGAPETDRGSDGAIQAKTWTFALVPKREGSYRIELPRFSYFDLASGSYKTTEARDFPLEVLPGDGAPHSLVDAASESGFAAVQDLSFIKLGELGNPDASPKLIHPRATVYVAAGMAALNLLAWLIVFGRNQIQSRRANYRPRYALPRFRKAVAALRRRAENGDAYYAGLSQAILDYFGDKWERAGQGLSVDYIQDRFDREGVDSEHGQRIKELIEACDLARFTPSSPSSREQLATRATAAIEAVEEALP